MQKRGRRAGQNIRELALKRRAKAVTSFAGAGLLFLAPFLIVNISNNFIEQIAPSNSSEVQQSFNMPLSLYAIFVVAALASGANGVSLWKRANNADQGARGEEEVSQALSQMEQEGWKIEYGLRLGNRLGDADIVCISPRDKAYVIDVKSHKGEVFAQGEQLNRRMGQTSYPFEKDFIAQVTKQALQVKKQKDLQFVTPILAFSQARVSIRSNRLRNVYIVEKSKLLSLLKSLG